MKKGLKARLAILAAATAGFVAGRWGNTETKERITQRFKDSKSPEDQRPLTPYTGKGEGEVMLDEFELLAFHQ